MPEALATPPVATPPVVPAAPVEPVGQQPVPGDQLGTSTPQDFEVTASALDDLLKQHEAEATEAAAEAPPAAPAATPAPAAPAAPVVPVAATPVETAKPAEPAAPAAPATDDFDKVELPPYTKPASVTAFATVKQMARDRIIAIEKEKAELAAKLLAAEEAAKKPATDNPELEELRKFRLKFDVEADPSFKTWDTSIADNEKLIYARLKSSGVEEASLKRIEELGGPSQVDWDALGDKVSPALKRYIEGKLFENSDLAEKKKLAIDAAKENASEFVKTRQEELYQNTAGRKKQVEVEFEALRPQMTWLKEVNPAVSASAEEKAAAAANNELVKKVQLDLQEAIDDDSPRMRAILLAGFAQLMRLRHDTQGAAAAHKSELEKLQASLAEKEAFIERMKKSSTARLSSSGSTPGEVRTTKKVDYNEDAGSALERHLREAQAKA